MKQLNIYELHNTINKKKNIRTSVFNTVLNKCHTKIKQAAEKEQLSIFYNIPAYIVGLPLYNLEECSKFIHDNLQQNGFKVTYIAAYIVHISWEIEKNKPLCLDETERLLLLNHIPDDTKKKCKDTGKNRKEKFILNVD